MRVAKTRVKLTHVKLPVEDFVRLQDRSRALANTGMAGACPGGRVLLSGYICCVCGEDPTPDDFKCPVPLDAAVKRLKENTHYDCD